MDSRDSGSDPITALHQQWRSEARATMRWLSTTPSIVSRLEGDANGAQHPAASAKKFTAKCALRNIMGASWHNLPQEAPDAFAKAVVDVDAFDRPYKEPKIGGSRH